MHHWLHRLGLSRLSVALLIVFFALGLGFEQVLPADEIIIQPNIGFLITCLPPFLFLYAIREEFRKPRVPSKSKTYWKSFGYNLVAFIIFCLFSLSFGQMKSLIPIFHPYALDPLFQRIDIFLHGGSAPSLWFIDMLTAPTVSMLNYIYLSSWVGLVSCYCFWQLTSAPSQGRSQFLSCFYSVWIILGIFLATALSSVGPIYYALFYSDAYSVMNADFVTRLYSNTNDTASLLDARNLLIGFMNDGRIVHFNGMSAMPSLHTATSMLMALHSYHFHRRLAWFMIPFAVIIFLGSFILGWHYAIDTYVSAIALAFIWRITQHDIRAQSALH